MSETDHRLQPHELMQITDCRNGLRSCFYSMPKDKSKISEEGINAMTLLKYKDKVYLCGVLDDEDKEFDRDIDVVCVTYCDSDNLDLSGGRVKYIKGVLNDRWNIDPKDPEADDAIAKLYIYEFTAEVQEKLEKSNEFCFFKVLPNRKEYSECKGVISASKPTPGLSSDWWEGAKVSKGKLMNNEFSKVTPGAPLWHKEDPTDKDSPLILDCIVIPECYDKCLLIPLIESDFDFNDSNSEKFEKSFTYKNIPSRRKENASKRSSAKKTSCWERSKPPVVSSRKTNATGVSSKKLTQLMRGVFNVENPGNRKPQKGTAFAAKFKVDDETTFYGIMSAHHVITSASVNKENKIKFELMNRESKSKTGDMIPIIEIYHGSHLKEGSHVDFMFLRVDEESRKKMEEKSIDFLKLSSEDVDKVDYIDGVRVDQMKVIVFFYSERGTLFGVNPLHQEKWRDKYFIYVLDTSPGSSGGPLIRKKDHKVMGIHHGKMKKSRKEKMRLEGLRFSGRQHIPPRHRIIRFQDEGNNDEDDDEWDPNHDDNVHIHEPRENYRPIRPILRRRRENNEEQREENHDRRDAEGNAHPQPPINGAAEQAQKQNQEQPEIDTEDKKNGENESEKKKKDPSESSGKKVQIQDDRGSGGDGVEKPKKRRRKKLRTYFPEILHENMLGQGHRCATFTPPEVYYSTSESSSDESDIDEVIFTVDYLQDIFGCPETIDDEKRAELWKNLEVLAKYDDEPLYTDPHPDDVTECAVGLFTAVVRDGIIKAVKKEKEGACDMRVAEEISVEILT